MAPPASRLDLAAFSMKNFVFFVEEILKSLIVYGNCKTVIFRFPKGLLFWFVGVSLEFGLRPVGLYRLLCLTDYSLV